MYFNPVDCALRPVAPAFVTGGLLSVLDMVQNGGRPPTARTFGIYVGGIYVYNLLQCPMEAVNGGRPSAWHNVAAGGTLGYLGVSRGVLGIPFLPRTFFYQYPALRPAIAGAAVYATMGGFLAVLGGKRL